VLQTRVDMEASALISDTLRILVTYRGWLKPNAGGLWELGESVTVKSPMLMTEKIPTMKVWEVHVQPGQRERHDDDARTREPGRVQPPLRRRRRPALPVSGTGTARG
jgi:hypothetical protein